VIASAKTKNMQTGPQWPGHSTRADIAGQKCCQLGSKPALEPKRYRLRSKQKAGAGFHARNTVRFDPKHRQKNGDGRFFFLPKLCDFLGNNVPISWKKNRSIWVKERIEKPHV
jgi:hypothetical protein